jgi:SAM-dependent methyltransferase
MDPIQAFKDKQREGWAHFAPLEAMTTPAAASLVRHGGVRAGQRVLDVACGTGVVAITAALAGGSVTGLDLTPALLARARENAQMANVAIDFHEGDAEKLPFEDAAFDVVLSQFGHMFAPRPDVVMAELLRVLKPGGTIAFATWPPDLFIGRMFVLISSYLPPPPAGVSPPVQWGVPSIVRERLGDAVRDIVFDTDVLYSPSLSPQHYRDSMERTAGPLINLVQTLTTSDPARLDTFRRELEALIIQYRNGNQVHQGFLMTRAIKR